MKRAELRSRGLMGFSEEDEAKWRTQGRERVAREKREQKEAEAEAHKREIELEKLKQTGARSLAELTRGEGTSGLTFAQRRAIHTDAQRYIDSMRDTDTGEILHPKSGRPLNEKEVQGIYRNKTAELENIYLGGAQPGTRTMPKKEPMVVTGKVKIGNRTLSQQDLKRIMGLSDEDVVFRKDVKGKIAAPPSAPAPPPPAGASRSFGASPAPMPRKPITRGDVAAAGSLAKVYQQRAAQGTPRLNEPAMNIAQAAYRPVPSPVPEATPLQPSLRETITQKPVQTIAQPSQTWQTLQGTNLADIIRTGITKTGPLWDYLRRAIHTPVYSPLGELNAADIFR